MPCQAGHGRGKGTYPYGLYRRTAAEAKERTRTDSTVVQQQAQFPFPEIPATLTEPEARKAWLLTHYWDKFSFADTTLVNNRDITEQGFVNFIALLADGTTPDELMRESMENWCRRFIPSTTNICMECIWKH